jgi:hypothetical protein
MKDDEGENADLEPKASHTVAEKLVRTLTINQNER